MNYISLDIWVDFIGRRPIERRRLEFHKAIAELIFGENELVRIGIDLISTMDFNKWLRHPEFIRNILSEAIKICRGSDTDLDFCILDFTSNPFEDIHDPVLIELADVIGLLCIKGQCSQFIVMMRKFPGLRTASLQRFEQITNNMPKDKTFNCVMIDYLGNTIIYSNNNFIIKDIKSQYLRYIERLLEDPSRKLDAKCVRRLGHFGSYDMDNMHYRCRMYSYKIFESKETSEEMRRLLEDWWSRHGSKNNIILYDLKNNPKFREVVISFAQRNAIKHVRLLNIIDDTDREGLDKAGKGECILILDAVETGYTLNRYLIRLEQMNLKIAKDVLAVINKTGNILSLTAQHAHNVYGLIKREPESSPLNCPQCELELPLTSDWEESHIGIRSYDMLYMAKDAGYGPEHRLEKPKFGRKYDWIPDCSQILSKYGDWIAYKIYSIIDKQHSPVDLFIIHPEEQHSSAISNKLLTLLEGKLCVIKVPRQYITEAEEGQNKWIYIREKYPNDNLWQELDALENSAGLILDIFTGSDSTLNSLNELLRFHRLSPFAFAGFIDFYPNRDFSKSPGIKRYSLYEWFNPREMVTENE